jgi:hypothetical protein
VLLGNGDGTFQATRNFATDSSPAFVAVADVNGDHHPDIVTASPGSIHVVSVLLGNGNGTFQAAQLFPTGSMPDAIAVADVNGDGHPDLITANNSGRPYTVSVLLGNGDGTFGAAQNFAVGYHPTSVAVADVNGDGIPISSPRTML